MPALARPKTCSVCFISDHDLAERAVLLTVHRRLLGIDELVLAGRRTFGAIATRLRVLRGLSHGGRSTHLSRGVRASRLDEQRARDGPAALLPLCPRLRPFARARTARSLIVQGRSEGVGGRRARSRVKAGAV